MEAAALPAHAPELADALRRAVDAALRARGVERADFSLTLLADGEIAELNGRYLGHAGPTDVLSFALHEEGSDPIGDVYVGLAQAERQALEEGISLGEELVRLAVHGTLHVLGFDHPEGEERMGGEMWRVQEEIVSEIVSGGAR